MLTKSLCMLIKDFLYGILDHGFLSFNIFGLHVFMHASLCVASFPICGRLLKRHVLNWVLPAAELKNILHVIHLGDNLRSVGDGVRKHDQEQKKKKKIVCPVRP